MSRALTFLLQLFLISYEINTGFRVLGDLGFGDSGVGG